MIEFTAIAVDHGHDRNSTTHMHSNVTRWLAVIQRPHAARARTRTHGRTQTHREHTETTRHTPAELYIPACCAIEACRTPAPALWAVVQLLVGAFQASCHAYSALYDMKIASRPRHQREPREQTTAYHSRRVRILAALPQLILVSTISQRIAGELLMLLANQLKHMLMACAATT